jgi:hypothetical protein
MLPNKLQELWDGMERNREITLDAARSLSEAEFCLSVDGGWSVAEILEHLIIAETGTSKVIRKCLKDNAGKLPPYPAADSVLTVRPPRTPPAKATEAPEAAIPSGGAGKEEMLARAAECRRQMRVSLEMLAGADPRAAEFPHVLFGNLNLYEWPCIIVLGHERQHHPQIEAILRKLKG